VPYGGEAGRALRADEAALKTCHRTLVGQQRLVGHAHGGPAGGIQRVEDEEIAQGLRHREAERHRLGIRPRLALGGAGLEGLDDRRAALRLDGDQPREVTGHPAELEQFAQGLVDADDADAPAGGVHDHAGHPPAELLGDLQAHRLLALDAVRLPERGGVLVAGAPGQDLGDQPAGVADIALDQVQLGAGRRAFSPGDPRGRGRHHDQAAHPRPGGVHRPGGPGVAVGRHGDRRDAQLGGPRHADGGAARLERAGGQQALILH
jgi:hypothetical protein